MDNLISILFAGDYAPCRGFEGVVLKRGGEVFGELLDVIRGADVSFVNLETPLCKPGVPIQKDGGCIRSDPGTIGALVEAGVTVVGLANNHVMDFGTAGLQETMHHCRDAKLLTCGAGENLDRAQDPCKVCVAGMNIAIIAVAEHEFSIADAGRGGAAPLCPIDNVKQIRSARQDADLVFVTLHGGNEYFPYPRPGLRKLCQFLIEEGADGVICHHPHVPGAREMHCGKPIVYSLGNLIFDSRRSRPYWKEGYVVRLRYQRSSRDLESLDIIPYSQAVEHGGVRLMTGEVEAKTLERLAQYDTVLRDVCAYEQMWRSFCAQQRRSILMRQYAPITVPGISQLGRFVDPGWLFLGTRLTRSVKRNIVWCESHLELLQSVLEQEHRGGG